MPQVVSTVMHAGSIVESLLVHILHISISFRRTLARVHKQSAAGAMARQGHHPPPPQRVSGRGARLQRLPPKFTTRLRVCRLVGVPAGAWRFANTSDSLVSCREHSNYLITGGPACAHSRRPASASAGLWGSQLEPATYRIGPVI